MKILLTLFVSLFIISGCEQNYIKDFKIEGVAIGDKLIDFYTEKEILEYQWNYYPDSGFNSSGFFPRTKTYEYEQIEVGYKTNDSKFTVHFISGIIDYQNDIENCYSKKNQIVKKLSQTLNNFDWTEQVSEDSEGSYDIEYIVLETGEYLSVECYDWKKEIENRLGWIDHLSVQISTDEWESMLSSE